MSRSASARVLLTVRAAREGNGVGDDVLVETACSVHDVSGYGVGSSGLKVPTMTICP